MKQKIIGPLVKVKGTEYKVEKKYKLYNLVKIFCFAFIVLFIANPLVKEVIKIYSVKADSVALGWAQSVGGSGFDYIYDSAVDSSGNVYSTGYFNSTLDFDPGAGTANLTSSGSADIFVLKLDSSGNFLWAKSVGNASFDYGNALAVDSSGNVYITGYYYNTADFDPGVGTANLTSAGGSDVFILKLDSSGNYVWAKSMGSTLDETGYDVAVDSSGNVYLSGNFEGTADFDPGAGTANLVSAGSDDIYISKLDSSGNFVWAKQVGGTGYDSGVSLAVDASGNIYSTGSFRNTVDFDPGAGTANLTSAGDYDIYVLKFDSTGSYVWADRMGGTGYEYGNSVAVDSSSNVYITGGFYASGDFDPGAGTANLSPLGTGDIFVEKLDSSGAYVWAKQFGGPSSNSGGYGIAVDSSNNVYTAGPFTNTVDFDPSGSTYDISSFGSNDVFVSKLNSSGNFVWAKQLGGTAYDWTQSVAVDSSSNVYVGGGFQGLADFDPGSGINNLTPSAGADVFLVKLSPVSIPTLAAPSATSITTTGVNLASNITATGGEAATSRGFEYGLTTSYGSSFTESSGPYSTGSFNTTLSGLTCGSTYHFRAFATNSAGTGTSTDNSFNTDPCTSNNGGGFVAFPGVGLPAVQQTPTNTNTTPTTNTQTPTTPTQTSGLLQATPEPITTIVSSTLKFLRNLGFGSIGEDVRQLQTFLNQNSFKLDTSGAGAPGEETDYYGPKTQAAVSKFQEAHKEEILTPQDITEPTGYFGKFTRALINSMVK